MQHILVSHIMHHGKRHNLLYDLQHGFRDKRSCKTQLLQFQDDLIRNMSNGAETDVLIMDFAKAFDKVGHRRLLRKLNYYGIDKKTQIWVQGFLADRTQTAVLDGEKSYVADVVSGVPQGSVIGPCLFLYYINDIPVGLESTVRLFADDTIAYLNVTPTNDARTLQQDLHKLRDWEKKWYMEFHPAKCQVLTVSRKRNPIHYEYKLHGHILEHVTSAKYLGVTFTSDIRWGQHVNNITSKANKTLNFIRRNLQISSPKPKTTAYTTLVRPLLEFAPSVWDPYVQKDIKKVEMVQRRAARYVTNWYHNTSSVTDMLNHLQWTSLETRRQHQRLVMLYKIHHDIVAVPAATYMTPATRITRHTHPLTYQVPTYATDYGRFSFFPRTIQDWKNLPRHVAEAPSPDSYRAHLSKGLQTA